MMNERADSIARVCSLLAAGDTGAARDRLRVEYPFESHSSCPRRYTINEALAVFYRDAFIDRYSGDRLVFPGVLRLLAHHFPAEFPYHRNWKIAETHRAFWQLSPTIDHVVPVSRGGLDHEGNRVTTSMLRNSAKSSWTLEELGWSLKPPGSLQVWDGLLGWFRSYVSDHPETLQIATVREWHRAARAF